MRSSTVVVVNPSPDVYGADLQMLQTVTALIDVGRPGHRGAAGGRRRWCRGSGQCGAEIEFLDFPVLRKGNASAEALLTMMARARGLRCLAAAGLLRRLRPAALIVNTVTLPWWLLVGRLTRTPTIGHLHEAETEAHRLVRKALIAPLFWPTR